MGMIKDDSGEIKWGAIVSGILVAGIIASITSIIKMGNHLERVTTIQENVLRRLEINDYSHKQEVDGRFTKDDSYRLKLEMVEYAKREHQLLDERITREVQRITNTPELHNLPGYRIRR